MTDRKDGKNYENKTQVVKKCNCSLTMRKIHTQLVIVTDSWVFDDITLTPPTEDVGNLPASVELSALPNLPLWIH